MRGCPLSGAVAKEFRKRIAKSQGQIGGEKPKLCFNWCKLDDAQVLLSSSPSPSFPSFPTPHPVPHRCCCRHLVLPDEMLLMPACFQVKLLVRAIAERPVIEALELTGNCISTEVRSPQPHPQPQPHYLQAAD